MLWEELKESLIFLNREEKCEKDILKKMGGALVSEGYAKDTYVQALLRREQDFPTGLDIHGIGIAIPHTDPCHVKKEGAALAVMKEPITFRHMEDEGVQVAVRLIFMLAVSDPEIHLKRLQCVLNVIQDAEALGQLLTARDKKDIIRIIKTKEDTL